MNDPKHEPRNTTPPELAAALEAMSGGSQPPISQEGQTAMVIGPMQSVRSRPVVSAKKRNRDQLFVQRTFIPPLLVLGILLPALGLMQRMIDPDNPLSARNLAGISILLPIVGLIALGAGIANMLSVKKKLGKSCG